MIWPYILSIIALAASALFSAYEIAFLSSNKLLIEIDRKEGKRYAVLMGRFLDSPDLLISSLLVGNNVSLVIYGISIAAILNPVIAGFLGGLISDGALLGVSLAIETVVSTLIVLITGEFLPKTLSRLNPNGVFSSLFWLILLFHWLFYPITAIIKGTSYMFMSLFGMNTVQEGRSSIFDKTDLMNLSEEVVADEDEQDCTHDIEIFQNALNFSKVKLRECMIPRTEIVAVDIEDGTEALFALFKDSGFSRIVVYSGSIDNIIGYVHTKDLFSHRSSTLQELLRPIVSKSEETGAQYMLAYMVKNSISIAAVKDEWGGTAGIVTMEDLIEEIFGKIDDETDHDNEVCKKNGENRYVISARMEIEEINQRLKLSLPLSREYETLAGFIIFKNENIPMQNDVVTIDAYRFTILKATRMKIDTVELKIMDKQR